jgi:hypothetical protein
MVKQVLFQLREFLEIRWINFCKIYCAKKCLYDLISSKAETEQDFLISDEDDSQSG